MAIFRLLFINTIGFLIPTFFYIQAPMNLLNISLRNNWNITCLVFFLKHIFRHCKIFKESQSRRGLRDNLTQCAHLTDGDTEAQRGKGISQGPTVNKWQPWDWKHSVLISHCFPPLLTPLLPQCWTNGQPLSDLRIKAFQPDVYPGCLSCGHKWSSFPHNFS